MQLIDRGFPEKYITLAVRENKNYNQTLCNDSTLRHSNFPEEATSGRNRTQL